MLTAYRTAARFNTNYMLLAFQYRFRFCSSYAKEEKIAADVSNKTTKSEYTYEDIDYEIMNTLKMRKKAVINELIVYEKSRQYEEGSRQDLRDAILFDEILRTEKNITLYDAYGKVFRYYYALNWGCALFAAFLFYYYITNDQFSHSLLWYCVPCVLFAGTRLTALRRFYKAFVDRVVYDTELKTFTITKRSFFTAKPVEQTISKNLLLFTSDTHLNNRYINYINMETLECYQIGYTYAWKNQALFSHLIDQRIKSIKK